jgi:hypothetical protein
MKWLATILLTCGVILKLHAQGYIVPNGVSYFGLNFLGGYEIRVLQNPTNTDYTGFLLTPQGKTPPSSLHINTFSFSGYVDEGVRVFLVSSNQPITQQAIQSGSYTELMFPSSYVFNHGARFYVGLYTGYNPFSPTGTYTGIYTDPLFGWAQLVNNAGVIQLLDSALVYNAGGIFAGTQTMIPEPRSLALGILGAALIEIRRRARL